MLAFLAVGSCPYWTYWTSNRCGIYAAHLPRCRVTACMGHLSGNPACPNALSERLSDGDTWRDMEYDMLWCAWCKSCTNQIVDLHRCTQLRVYIASKTHPALMTKYLLVRAGQLYIHGNRAYQTCLLPMCLMPHTLSCRIT